MSLMFMFCTACKQKGNRLEETSTLPVSHKQIPKDTYSTYWYPIDFSETKNHKLCLEYSFVYRYSLKNDKLIKTVRSKTMKILYYDQNLKEKSVGDENEFKIRSNFKTLYTTESSDSLMLDDVVQESVKYYGNYFIVFFPKWIKTCQINICDIPEDENGFILYQPSVFYIDTLNMKVSKLKNNPNMKATSGKNRDVIPFVHSNGSGFDRNFAFSIQKKEFVFGRRYVLKEGGF